MFHYYDMTSHGKGAKQHLNNIFKMKIDVHGSDHRQPQWYQIMD